MEVFTGALELEVVLQIDGFVIQSNRRAGSERNPCAITTSDRWQTNEFRSIAKHSRVLTSAAYSNKILWISIALAQVFYYL